MAFWEILLLALLCASNYVSCMVKQEISNISLSVWYVGCQSHGILGNLAVFPLKSTISQSCQNKFNNLIPPSYGLHFGKYKMGIIGKIPIIGKIHHIYAKCHVNKFINMSTVLSTCI